MANNKITTTELDFDKIKTSLKTYLQGQSQFSDYDFEGSGLSVLLDVLAYNTHYNALYTNLAINEAFLDSASKRSSVVSKAKELGYIPSSARASTAVVDVTMINNQISAPTAITIPVYTQFTTQVDGNQYVFYTTEAHTAINNSGTYEFTDVTIKEGSVLTFTYVVDDNTEITIPNAGVDLSTLKVIVQPNAQSSAFDVYELSDTIIDITSDSKVYFVKEIDGEIYQLEFGNNVIGKQLVNGNVVTITYFVCNKDLPNGASSFLYNGTLVNNTTSFVTTTTSAQGGTDVESIDNIKWNAPRAYTAQNRCVTVEDYRSIIKSMYPEAKSISVWGGETNTPPQYGKVFISIVPNSTDFLTQDQKTYIINNVVNPRKVLTITPEIVDPTYLKIELSTAVYYDPQQTTRSSSDIETLVRNTINNYNATYLNDFGGVFKYSQIGRQIDAAEQSVTSNITTIKLHREVNPVFNIKTGYTVNIGNPIYNSGVPEESVISTGFYSTDSSEVCYIDDVPVEGANIGALRLFYYNTSGQKVTIRNVGSIDYVAGIIDVQNINVTGLYSEKSEWIIKPQSNDVISVQNQFVEIDPELTTITVIAEATPGSYTFTSSRN